MLTTLGKILRILLTIFYLSPLLKQKRIIVFFWVAQIRTGISHYQKMVFFLIKLQLNKYILLLQNLFIYVSILFTFWIYIRDLIILINFFYITLNIFFNVRLYFTFFFSYVRNSTAWYKDSASCKRVKKYFKCMCQIR